MEQWVKDTVASIEKEFAGFTNQQKAEVFGYNCCQRSCRWLHEHPEYLPYGITSVSARPIRESNNAKIN